MSSLGSIFQSPHFLGLKGVRVLKGKVMKNKWRRRDFCNHENLEPLEFSSRAFFLLIFFPLLKSLRGERSSSSSSSSSSSPLNDLKRGKR